MWVSSFSGFWWSCNKQVDDVYSYAQMLRCSDACNVLLLWFSPTLGFSWLSINQFNGIITFPSLQLPVRCRSLIWKWNFGNWFTAHTVAATLEGGHCNRVELIKVCGVSSMFFICQKELISNVSNPGAFFRTKIIAKILFRQLRMEGGPGVGGGEGEDTEKMWKYQWTMSPVLRLVGWLIGWTMLVWCLVVWLDHV